MTGRYRSTEPSRPSHLPTRRALGDDGRFTTIPASPRDAWLEGVVNAVTHREMRLARLAEPFYVEGDRDVTLTLSASPVDEALESRLPTTARAIVQHLRQHQRASTGELIKVTGLSRPVVLRHLDILRREEVVAWHGTAPQDPRAYWYLPS